MLSNTKTVNVSKPKNKPPVDQDYSSDSKDGAAGSDKENTVPDEIEGDIQHGREPEGPTPKAKRLAKANIRYHKRIVSAKSSERLYDTQERSNTKGGPVLNESVIDKDQLAEEESSHEAEQSPKVDNMPSPDEDPSGTYMPSGSEPDDEASESTSSAEKEKKTRRCKSSPKASSTPASTVETDSDAPLAAHRKRPRPASPVIDLNMYGTSSVDRVKRANPIDGPIDASRRRKRSSEEPVQTGEDDTDGNPVENQVDFDSIRDDWMKAPSTSLTPIAGPSFADRPIADATTGGIEADVNELEAALDNAHSLLQRLKKRVGKM